MDTSHSTGPAGLPEADRDQIIQTEHFTRLTPGPTKGDPAQLTI